ncbi:MAG: GNAT family N-acetyltransferase [Oscillospiraceae bacterium]|nr:GNAT family N-acetyltransferase [Oscillospiraceae bacterium]
MELELKYRVPCRAVLEQLVAGAALEWREIAMETVYYDTPDRALGARRWTLRLRREGGVPVLCCKTPGGTVHGVQARGEWECPGDDPAAGIARLVRLGAPAELAELAADGLVPLCGARFTRRAARVRLDGAEAELAADCGVLTGGGWAMPFFELEAEHKAGDPAVSIACGEALVRRYGLEAEPRSKFQRAFALCGREAVCVQAAPAEAGAVHDLVQRSIQAVYPRCYPAQAVDFFRALHSPEAIAADVAAGEVLLLRVDGSLAATASRRGHHVSRLYVDPAWAGQGCGGYLMDRLEAEIAGEGGAARVEASLPAAHFYERRGYRTIAHRSLPLADGAVLVYEEMEKAWNG